MRFSRVGFNRFIENIGQAVIWMASYACPCTDPHTSAPDPKCTLCAGRGHVWDDGIQTTVGICTQKTQERWSKMGFYETGDMVITIPENSPMWAAAGQYDRVLTLSGLDGFSEVLFHGAPTEKLRMPIHLIYRVFWKDPVTKQIVEGGIPSFDNAGNLRWVSGEPPLGLPYSVTGDRYSEYYMFDMFPSDRNEQGGMRLPKNSVLRKWDVMARAGQSQANPPNYSL